MRLNDNQERHLLNTLEHVDKLLCDVERIPSDHGDSRLFPEYLRDLSPREHARLSEGIRRFRAKVARLLQAHDLEIAPPRISARKAVMTALLFADMALEELSPRRMRDYGPISSQETSMELEEVVDALRVAIREIRDELLPGSV